MNKKINWYKTLIFMISSFTVFGFLFANAVIYSTSFITNKASIPTICFWVIITLLLAKEFTYMLTIRSFIFYKNNQKSKGGKQK